MLGTIKQEKLEEAEGDDAFLAHMDRVDKHLKTYLTARSWYRRSRKTKITSIAYFSAEFGITEAMPLYSGGLGVLAGDYLKSASDLGVPMVGVGLLYQEGYFEQYLNSDGWQQESYPENDFYNLPIRQETDGKGMPLVIAVQFPERTVYARIWRAQIGRIPLYMLDTNVPENRRVDDRRITERLYGGDREYRLRQEIMLGVGGLHALEALGIHPNVYHMNEGHSALLVIERIRKLVKTHGLSFDQAHELILASSVFTTHTSVPAGFDIYPFELIDTYFSTCYKELGIKRDDFLALAQRGKDSQEFNMAVLALKNTSFSNGVSAIHGKISRDLWKDIWPQVPPDEIPVTSITNGVHIPSWISKDMGALFNRYMGPKWSEEPLDSEVWNRIEKIPDEELWRTHERRRERLVAFARHRLRVQLERRGVPRSEVDMADEVLDPSILTIGFARRFATYKRADLLLKDHERLAGLLSNETQPIQIIYAGKAHPKDSEAKNILREIIHLARHEPFRRKVVFIEDYSMQVSRYMVQGVDLWLNTPRRLMEASGTSGMKAAANGAINMSILDGWWDEAYRNDIGWAIGHGEVYQDFEYQDRVESNDIYRMLENEIIPMFYARGPDKLPRRWIARMKAGIRTICPFFNCNRMMYEYCDRFYIPCAQRFTHLSGDDYSRAAILAKWKRKIRSKWTNVAVKNIKSDGEKLEVGSGLRIRADVSHGGLESRDITVQIYYGRVDAGGEIVDGKMVEMTQIDGGGDSFFTFEGVVPCERSGMQGYTVRVLPKHEDLGDPLAMNLIRWA
jgi:starch phosphorylase